MASSLFIGCAIQGGAIKACSAKGCGTKGCCVNKAVNNAESLEPVNPTDTQNAEDISIHQVVEAACGQCQFGMTEKLGCDLAVRIDGKSYFVDGTSIHDHGDAHADDGFCRAIRQAEVKGEIVDGRFKAESFTLVK